MVDESDIAPESQPSGAVPYKQIVDSPDFPPESDAEAESRGPDEAWVFWDGQIRAGLVHERRWRHEAGEVEVDYFGEDNDTGAGSPQETMRQNRISDKTAMIHANIDVLKPLLFSETPQPVVRRRFRGDGKADETDLMAAEVGQRIAQFLLDTEKFDKAMYRVRDDWLIAGRGSARVYYSADVQNVDIVDPATGTPISMPIKVSEKVAAKAVEWRRLLLAPTHSWENMPWIAFETPMTRSMIDKRFGPEVAGTINYSQKGLIDLSQATSDADREARNVMGPDNETGTPAISPFDVVMVWEIWNKDSAEVIWWSSAHTDGVLDREEDPLGLEGFWPMPEPLLGSTKGDSMTPRPDIKYYEHRAREVEIASNKLKRILDTLSVSGLFPGQMSDEVKKLFDGTSKMIPIESWQALIEKGGAREMIQWLPIDMMVSAASALIQMREQAKQAMFEASGVSDVMRAQSNPNETATAQQIKGRYAGLRLSDRQRRIALYARDLLRMMIELAVEHYDTERLADICAIDIPMTEMERQSAIAQQEAAKTQFEQLSKMHAQMAQMIQQGQMQGPVPPAPKPPKFDRIPETSWELVHARLRDDVGRKITVTIETQSTVLADEQADKETRVEFLKAFSMFVQELAPLMQSGQFNMKMVKELLMFGVRGFPKSRTLESLIADMPDEPQGKKAEDPSVTVAKIRAEVDKMVEQMRLADKEKERAHNKEMVGVEARANLGRDLTTKAADTALKQPPVPNGAH